MQKSEILTIGAAVTAHDFIFRGTHEVDQMIKCQLAKLLADEIIGKNLMTISEHAEPVTMSRHYRASIAIVDAGEFERLKALEKKAEEINKLLPL